ncbi:DNA adenine methylase [Lyngbya sp. CCY1209]|uniref:DNA adenine methylase n=1 Tax=Lyngbya sp. CCY1209 TaxID=2886103 RepID=UPI002D201B78|nr:DNA adenine methylase [Lyngbya sp. CCY1209]MEB3886680.1 DNA adenine methylase [Lyngbya sp. CCY1209]
MTKSPQKTAQPFLKWAGGKSQLLSQFENLYPLELKQGQIQHYIEPFIGGGAVFFEVAQKYQIASASIYDINPELILVYQVIQKDVERLIEEVGNLARDYHQCPLTERKCFYFKLRDRYNLQKQEIGDRQYDSHWVSRAALLIFLNRTCFNGLFRLNSKGEFNVPPGSYKNPKILDADNLRSVSELLQIAEIAVGDFELCEPAIKPGTLIYFDPPYRPLSKTANFTSYSTFTFCDRQQTRLAQFFRHLDTTHDVKMMLSNSDPKNEDPTDDFFEELYQPFKIHRVSANRAINSNGKKRGQIDELVITNY